MGVFQGGWLLLLFLGRETRNRLAETEALRLLLLPARGHNKPLEERNDPMFVLILSLVRTQE